MARAPGTERTVQISTVPLPAEIRDAVTAGLLDPRRISTFQTPFKALEIIVHKPGYKGPSAHDRLVQHRPYLHPSVAEKESRSARYRYPSHSGRRGELFPDRHFALRASIAARQAAKASARWGAEAATSTAVSPICRLLGGPWRRGRRRLEDSMRAAIRLIVRCAISSYASPVGR